jgi:hypothetical protein
MLAYACASKDVRCLVVVAKHTRSVAYYVLFINQSADYSITESVFCAHSPSFWSLCHVNKQSVPSVQFSQINVFPTVSVSILLTATVMMSILLKSKGYDQ